MNLRTYYHYLAEARVTAFHMDRECGFLLQVRGSKEINLFNQGDREVVPESEVEAFWTKDNNAPVYRPHLQDRATIYRLAPGNGVHIPINAPHWIRNGDNVSVSVNINFIAPETERGNIYRANYLLRQLGLNPTPPFRSPLLDRIKSPIGGFSDAGGATLIGGLAFGLAPPKTCWSERTRAARRLRLAGAALNQEAHRMEAHHASPDARSAMTVHALFAAAASRSPGSPAVVCGRSRPQLRRVGCARSNRLVCAGSCADRVSRAEPGWPCCCRGPSTRL